MARDYRVNGETLVQVKFGQHIEDSDFYADNGNSTLFELGLASEGIQITPRYSHQDIRTDDWGPDVPAEIMANLADCNIRMRLIHYDVDVLDACLAEALGMNGGEFFAGVMPPAGSLLGGYVPYLQSGYHFVSLNLTSPVLNFPWHFPASFLTGPPVTIPLSTRTTLADLSWRAIPYQIPLLANGNPNFDGELRSSGAILWNHILDTAGSVTSLTTDPFRD